MKTTNHNKRATRKRTPIPRKGSPRRSIDSRDLNVDDQATNAPVDEDSEKKLNDATAPGDRTVEEEEDREAKRKSADANPADDIQN